jgi:CYTH domain-containing protein
MQGSAAQRGLITNMYLGEDEFEVLAQLRAKQLTETRYSVPPFVIDVFEGALEGLVLADAEFDSAADAESLTLRAFVFREVSDDDRFTGGQLVGASRKQVRAWLLEYGIKLTSA